MALSVQNHILSRQSKARRLGANQGCGGVKVTQDIPLRGVRHKKAQKVYVTTCDCSEKTGFFGKLTNILGAVATGIAAFLGISSLFKKEETADASTLPAETQVQQTSDNDNKSTTAQENNTTYFGGMLTPAVTITAENGEGDSNAGTFSENINDAAEELKEMYSKYISNIEVTGDDTTGYTAKITYKDAEGKTQTKDVSCSDSQGLVNEVSKLIPKSSDFDNQNLSVEDAAVKLKQMYAGIIKDIELTQNSDGKYTAKITIADTLKYEGRAAVSTVTVSNAQELDKAVDDFTAELFTTEDNNPFKTYNNFLSEINGSNKQANIENIDEIVNSQIALMDTNNDGVISEEEMLNYELSDNNKDDKTEIMGNVALQFNVFDQDRDGTVTSDELTQFYNEAAGEDRVLTADEYNAKMQERLTNLESEVAAEIESEHGYVRSNSASSGIGNAKEKKKPAMSTDNWINMIKTSGVRLGQPTPIKNQFVKYVDNNFVISDNREMTNSSPISEDDLKKLYEDWQ